MQSRSLFGELHRPGDEEAVVEDVVVGQRRALGKAGGAAGELDVDRVVELQRLGERGEVAALGVAAQTATSANGIMPACALLADGDDEPQIGELGGVEIAGRGMRQLGREIAQHADIVAGLEPRGGDQRGAARFVERVFELGEAVGRVDVDEDEPGLGGGELGDDPFGIVGRPDADPLAGLEAERDEAGGEGVDLALQLAIVPADVLMADDQRVALGKTLDDAVEMHADRLADQRNVAGAMNVARLRHSRFPPLRIARRPERQADVNGKATRRCRPAAALSPARTHAGPSATASRLPRPLPAATAPSHKSP